MSEEDRIEREKQEMEKRTEYDHKRQEQSLKATAEQPDRDDPAGQQAQSEKSQANDSNDPNYERPTTQDEVEENEMEEVEEEKPASGYPTRRPPRRGR
jgi:hypothetical protein